MNYTGFIHSFNKSGNLCGFKHDQTTCRIIQHQMSLIFLEIIHSVAGNKDLPTIVEFN